MSLSEARRGRGSVSQIGEAEAARLLALDRGLREEAERVLGESGLGAIIDEAGYQLVGSYAMHTMTWRDLDFERVEDPPDWGRHWAVGARLAATGWLWRAVCTDAYRDPRFPDDKGYYWGLRACHPDGGETWKLDIWTAREHEYLGLPERARWTAMLTDETRIPILAIKEAVCNAPEYRKTLLSVHIYEAVLDHGVRRLDDFMEWWRERYGAAQSTGAGG
jgi:hypothetical protein